MAVWRTKVKRADGTSCNHLDSEPCERCLQEKSRPIAMPATWSFFVDTYDNMFHPWEKPYEITSREQLRQECIARGVVNKGLKESTVWKDREDRWI